MALEFSEEQFEAALQEKEKEETHPEAADPSSSESSSSEDDSTTAFVPPPKPVPSVPTTVNLPPSPAPAPVPSSSASAPSPVPAVSSPVKTVTPPKAAASSSSHHATGAHAISPSDNPFVYNLTNSYFRLQAYLESQLGDLFPFDFLTKKTGINPAHIFLASFLLGFFFVAIGFFDKLICSFVGFAYPTIASLQALKTPTKTDDTHWLIYWVVFAWLNILEYFQSILLWCFPSWFVIKYLFLVWTTLPFTGGARIVYDQVVTRLVWLHAFVFTKLDKRD
jgi:receptor expression-enhancing protein 5/6